MRKSSKFKVQSLKFNSGFTFVEAILYVAIVTIIFSAIVPFSLQVIQGGAKSSIQQEVISQARFVAEKIKFEIRNAEDINVASSNFDSNLADNPTHQLSLQYPSPDNPTLITVASGQIMLKKGTATAVAINSTGTRVTNLAFRNNTSADNKTKNLTFTLTIEASNNSSRQEYIYTIDQTGSVELRSN